MRHMTLESGTSLRTTRESLGLSQAKLAEVSGIPQHILSSFELGKSDLAQEHHKLLVALLNNSAKLEAVARRKKRYRDHSYTTIEHDPQRVARQKITKENINYRSLIKRLDSRRETNKLKALSLFSGCGGFSLGFSWAGFDVRGYLEKDASVRAIYKQNFPSAITLGDDISKITNAESMKSATGGVDVIIGGPPCQGFSLAGKRDVYDPRNALFRHYLRVVDAYKPKVAVLENVRLLTSMKSPNGGFVKDEIRDDFYRHGYDAQLFEVNAKDFGIPQHRERIFFIAVRLDTRTRPSFPIPTHGESTERRLFDSLTPYRTFADACSDLAYLESGEASDDQLHMAVAHPKHVIDWLWDVKEGFSAHDNRDPRKRPPSGYNTTYKRQVWSEPASTVQTTFGMISGCRNVHPIATRSLTIREAARIQSFPDTFEFNGSAGTIRTGIGNAVPPLLAHAVASHIVDKFF